MGLRIRLTGRVGVEGAGAVLDSSELPGRQGRLVLAYLALNHHPVPRDELADVVWSGELPRSWERDLSAVVSRLKAVFARAGAPGVLEGALGCYELRLPPDAHVDVEDARRFAEQAGRELRADRLPHALGAAAAAEHIGRRRFLPGDEGDWADARRDELRNLTGRAYGIEAHCYRVQGNFSEALRYAALAVELEPDRESAYAELMRVHLDAGDRAEALRVYERCRRRLLDELGVPPAGEAEALHRRALEADVTPTSAPALPPQVVVALQPGPLVGRTGELVRIRDAWSRVRAGGFAAVLLAGEPGIGKTRLAAEFASEAHGHGARVLFGRCEPEPLASYQPFTEALRHWIAGVSAGEARAAGASHAAALAALLPELAAKLGEAPGRGAQDRLALYDAAAALLAAVGSTAPVVLLLDDLHAADLPTLALLRRLARAGRPGGVLILGTYRHAEPPPDAPFLELASELRLDGLAEEILLGGLDDSATAALVEARSGRRPDAAQARALRERTGGNPLFLRQLAGSGADVGSAGVADAVGRHVRRLPERTRDALAIASILGHDLEAAVLADVARSSRESMAGVLEPAIAAGLVAQAPDGRLTFSHPLVREGLYEGLGNDRRAALHERAGLALEALHPDATQALAFHFLRGGADRQKAIDYAAAAAEEAIRRLAWEDALDLLGQAIARLRPDEDERRRALLRRRGVAWQSVFTASLHPGVPVQVVADRQSGSGVET